MKLKNELFKNDLIKGTNLSRITQVKLFTLALLALFFLSSQYTFAHCDSYDGPEIKEAQEALASNNVNLVLKWVDQADEPEIKTLFNKTYALKTGDKEVYTIVGKHFLETLVRLHRAPEGVGYTGLKPAGSVSPIIAMADESIVSHGIEDLAPKFTAHIEQVVREKYDRAVALSLVKNESLEQGRAYVAAYVTYTHTLEEIHEIIEHSPGAHEH